EMGVQDAAESVVEQRLREHLVTGGELEGIDWQLISVTGDTAGELIRIAADRNAACVVVGKRHRGFAEFVHRLASGSVSRAVVASQKFPVLIVP
ncbi:MAG: universal stress protein, partial [Actinomycetota bacterium]|nr:universal stress protein [Actinomycetota bacterium]